MNKKNFSVSVSMSTYDWKKDIQLFIRSPKTKLKYEEANGPKLDDDDTLSHNAQSIECLISA